MLLINVHQLDVVLAESVRLCVLKHEVDDIRRIFCLEREDVVVLRSFQDFGERGEVDSESDVAVAAKR